MDRRMLKESAKQSVLEARGPVKRVTLILVLSAAALMLAEWGLGTLAERSASGSHYLSQTLSAQSRSYAAAMLISLVFQFLLVMLWAGYCTFSLRLSRGEDFTPGVLLDGFRVWGRVVLLHLYTALLRALWAMAFSLPVSYVLTALFLAETISEDQMLILLMAYAGLVMFIVSYRYRMAWRVMLDDPEIDENTKSCIVSNCGFSKDDLCNIFRKCDGLTAVTAMKKLSGADSAAAMRLVDEFVKSGSNSDEKYQSVCLGIAQYYEEHHTPEDIHAMQTAYIPMLKQIYEQNQSPLVRDQAVYAMARICDYELFTWLIENENIDDTLKISVIKRNYRLMKDQVGRAESEEDIRAVIDAMRILPMIEIADEMQNAVDAGSLPASEELLLLIDESRREGVHAIDKYEKWIQPE